MRVSQLRSLTRRLLIACVFAMLSAAPAAQVATTGAPAFDLKHLEANGIAYRLEVKAEPRPLRIHVLKVDLAHPAVELAAAPADDPDGDGPATAKLTPPMTLARDSRAVAFVNANPWRSLPDADGQRSTEWVEDMAVETLGLIVAEGKLRSVAAERYCAFWIDKAGKPHISGPDDVSQVREGVAGFLRLLDAGRSLHEPKPDDKVHPRTALGLDADGRFLFLVVVDGRQPGYSEGLSYAELADCMKNTGCTDAVNLDGGGSSIMIVADAKGERHVVNDPSTKKGGIAVSRPIPVGLCVRARK